MKIVEFIPTLAAFIGGVYGFALLLRSLVKNFDQPMGPFLATLILLVVMASALITLMSAVIRCLSKKCELPEYEFHEESREDH